MREQSHSPQPETACCSRLARQVRVMIHPGNLTLQLGAPCVVSRDEVVVHLQRIPWENTRAAPGRAVFHSRLCGARWARSAPCPGDSMRRGIVTVTLFQRFRVHPRVATSTTGGSRIRPTEEGPASLSTPSPWRARLHVSVLSGCRLVTSQKPSLPLACREGRGAARPTRCPACELGWAVRCPGPEPGHRRVIPRSGRFETRGSRQPSPPQPSGALR